MAQDLLFLISAGGPAINYLEGICDRLRLMAAPTLGSPSNCCGVELWGRRRRNGLFPYTSVQLASQITWERLFDVEWLKTSPATAFSLGAIHESGSAMSFFAIRNYADEFLALLTGEPIPAATADQEDVEVGYVLENIQQETRTFVLARMDQHLKGHP